MAGENLGNLSGGQYPWGFGAATQKLSPELSTESVDKFFGHSVV